MVASAILLSWHYVVWVIERESCACDREMIDEVIGINAEEEDRSGSAAFHNDRHMRLVALPVGSPSSVFLLEP